MGFKHLQKLPKHRWNFFQRAFTNILLKRPVYKHESLLLIRHESISFFISIRCFVVNELSKKIDEIVLLKSQQVFREKTPDQCTPLCVITDRVVSDVKVVGSLGNGCRSRLAFESFATVA